jgi:tagatose-1,6-bisphosphate aldolase
LTIPHIPAIIAMLREKSEDCQMNKVFIVVEPIPYEGDTVLRVFAKNEDAIAYGEQLVEDDVIDEFDVYEREVY